MFLTWSIKDFAKSLKTRNLVLVFGDQLDLGSAAFDDFDTGKGAVLIEREDGEECIKRIIPLAQKISEEKGHSGVITRDLFITMGRTIN